VLEHARVVVDEVLALWNVNATVCVPKAGVVPFDAEVYARNDPPFAGAVLVADCT